MHCKSTILFCAALIFANIFTLHAQSGSPSLETIIKNGEASGIIKREGNRLTFMASPAQDTQRIRGYYEDLIRKSGKDYVFRFQPVAQSATNPGQANTDTRNVTDVTARPVLQQVSTKIKGPDPIDQSVTQMNNQEVFGEFHYTDKTENYTWIVPEGVHLIRLEVWSGGGDGSVDTQMSSHVYRDGLRAITGLIGGAGGGGAYATASLVVEAGDKLLMTIPPGGGGKTVEILLNSKTNALYLNNGSDGKWNALFGKGYGGNSGGIYGKFKGKVAWYAGEQGGIPEVISYEFSDGGPEIFGQHGAIVDNLQVRTFGNGGSSPSYQNGGRGATLGNPFHRTDPGLNGGFPGGGGGGGVNGFGFSPGKGAPGMIIIHY